MGVFTLPGKNQVHLPAITTESSHLQLICIVHCAAIIKKRICHMSCTIPCPLECPRTRRTRCR